MRKGIFLCLNTQVIVSQIALRAKGVLYQESIIFLDLLVKLANELFSRQSTVIFILLRIAALNANIELIDGSIVILYSGSSQIASSWAE